MKDFMKYYTPGGIITAITCIVIGALFVIMPYSFSNVLVIITGILLFIGGIVLLIIYFAGNTIERRHGLAGAIVLIILGAYTVTHIYMIKGVLNTFFGIFIICIGSFFLARSVEALRNHFSGGVLSLVLSVLSVALGTVVLFGRFETIFVFTGIVLVITGIFLIILTIVYSSQMKKASGSSDTVNASWKEL